MAQQMDMQNMQDFMDQMNQNQESLLNHGADADSQDALKEVMNQSSMDFANTPSTETPLLDALDSMMNETSPDSMFQNTSFDMSSFGQ
ncbi:hypothetical protein [Neobacillus paridis]|nr:hypothetical protein [Neobacillus paridis]